MADWLNVLVANSLVVLPMAVAARLLSGRLRHPALVHAIWLLVLIKLVTPPFFRVPVSIQWRSTEQHVAATGSMPATERSVLPVENPGQNLTPSERERVLTASSAEPAVEPAPSSNADVTRP